MDLTWQDILTELQGLDVQQDPTYDNSEYVYQQPTVPLIGYNLCSYPRDGTVSNASHSMPSYSRMYMDHVSPHVQQVASHPLASAYGPTSFAVMSNVSQGVVTNHYASKLLPTSGIRPTNQAPLAEASLNNTHSLPLAWKGHEDFESDSGLSLNFSDGESVEIESKETFDVRSDYVELIPPIAYPCPNPADASLGQPLMQHTIAYESHPYTSHTQDLVCSRDERRAAALHIPFSTEKIINLPVEDFNELLSHYALTEAQLALVRDIRRRGKNKVAAQNCRKRKMENVAVLEREIEQLMAEREGLCKEREEVDRMMGELRNNMKLLQEEVVVILQNQGSPLYQEDLSMDT